MNTIKRSLVALLLLCLTVSCCAPAAFAEDTIRAEGTLFTLLLPADWEGKVLTQEDLSAAHPSFTVLHRASYESEGVGRLFSLRLWEDLSFVTLPSFLPAGILSDGERDWYLVAVLPTDMQAAFAYRDEYGTLSDREVFRRIFDTLEPAEGLSYRPLDEALAQAVQTAQARFEYWNVLSYAAAFNRLPYQEEFLPADWDAKLENNRFAVCDVDGDGCEELLISVEDSYMAGMRTVVYRWTEQGIQEEYRAFPVPEFYPNGVARAFASHNHTNGMSCWPYELSRYDEQSQSFVPYAAVCSWDREFAETDYDGTPFPAEADADGNGTVYFIGGAFDDGAWVDDAAFLAWEAEQLGGEAPIEIPWQAFTGENIDTVPNYDAAA